MRPFLTGHDALVEGGKDTNIESVLLRLQQDLVNDAFDVVDHWDDPCAVGVARSNDHRVLVYISTFPPELGKYAYQCERPPTDAEMPYDADDMVDHATYAELLDAVRVHLRP